jgi:hypothetical protein
VTRQTRLLIGSAIVLAVGCASSQRVAERVPPEDRIQLERAILESACLEIPDMGKVEAEVGEV